jgi:hypothetical protein
MVFQNLVREKSVSLQMLLMKFFLSDQLSEDELNLTQATLSDEQAYRFFTLRSSSRTSLQQQAMLEAMNVNLSDISKRLVVLKWLQCLLGWLPLGTWVKKLQRIWVVEMMMVVDGMSRP